MDHQESLTRYQDNSRSERRAVFMTVLKTDKNEDDLVSWFQVSGWNFVRHPNPIHTDGHLVCLLKANRTITHWSGLEIIGSRS